MFRYMLTNPANWRNDGGRRTRPLCLKNTLARRGRPLRFRSTGIDSQTDGVPRNTCSCYDHTNKRQLPNGKLFTDVIVLRTCETISCIQCKEDVSDRHVYRHENATTLIRLVRFILVRLEHLAYRKQRIMTTRIVVVRFHNLHTREGSVLFPVKVIDVTRAYR